MSLATRCTHCGTIFKVVQDQLKVSEGWVRCGRCQQVFNALPALFDLDKEPPPPRQTPPGAPQAVAGSASSGPSRSSPPIPAPTDATPPARSFTPSFAPPQQDDTPESQAPSGWEATQPTGLAAPEPALDQAPYEPASQAAPFPHEAPPAYDAPASSPDGTPFQPDDIDLSWPGATPAGQTQAAPPQSEVHQVDAHHADPYQADAPQTTPDPGEVPPYAPAPSSWQQPEPPMGEWPAPTAPEPQWAPEPMHAQPSHAAPAPQTPAEQAPQQTPEPAYAPSAAHQPDSLAAPLPAIGPLSEQSLALDPAPIEATTEFDLDTSIAVDDNTPLEDVIAATAPRTRAPVEPPPSINLDFQEPVAPAPWPSEPPQDVPSTDEADALDSRYLMPSTRERKTPRRRGQGPEFADAEFPNDAQQDAEDDWASDFSASTMGPESLPPANPEPKPQSALDGAPPPTSGLRATAASLAAALTLSKTSSAPDSQAASTSATALDDGRAPVEAQPSRSGEDFTPEQPNEPPSLRKGRPGTRGRDPAQQTPEFVKRAQRKAFWRHPATRTFLSVILAGLVLTLGMQLMHQFRDLLAAHNPESRPLLAQWCELVGCKLAPPLRLEDLQVESATLVRATSEGPDSYRLAVVVHNRGSIDLAWPHIDLTLTDENGAVIARRVFSPTDAQWLDTADPKADAPAGTAPAAAPAASTPTAAPSGRSTTLQWRLLAPDLHPANYTAELFYP
jgi:predicted Zn finger-like uncharacterized protein